MKLSIRIIGIDVITIEAEATTMRHEPDHEAIEADGGPPFGFSGSAGGLVERSEGMTDSDPLGWSTGCSGSPDAW